MERFQLLRKLLRKQPYSLVGYQLERLDNNELQPRVLILPIHSTLLP